MGHRDRVPPAGGLAAGRADRGAGAVGQRQCQPVPPRRFRGTGGSRHARRRRAARRPEAGAHREPPGLRHGSHHREDAAAQVARAGAVAGRFRHRLFLALLPEAHAAGPAEDRPELRARCDDRPERRRHRQDRDRPGAQPGPDRHRRRRGAAGAARLPVRTRLRCLPGLPAEPPVADEGAGSVFSGASRPPHRGRCRCPTWRSRKACRTMR